MLRCNRGRLLSELIGRRMHHSGVATKELTMKVFASSVVALSLITGGAAYAHPRVAVDSVAPVGQVRFTQSAGETSHNVPLYDVRSEDVSVGRYWTTPKELGGGLERGGGARVSLR